MPSPSSTCASEEGPEASRDCCIACISPDEIRVELLVPATVERCGDVETLPVKAELDHLRASSHPLPLGRPGVRSQGYAQVL